jgi:hypothetical protein
MDFLGPLPKSRSGKDMILVVIYRLTKMAHFIPIQSTVTSKETADLFLQNIFRQHGLPSTIVSDRDPLYSKVLDSAAGSARYKATNVNTGPPTDGWTIGSSGKENYYDHDGHDDRDRDHEHGQSTRPRQPDKYYGQRDFLLLGNWLFSVDQYFILTDMPARKRASYVSTLLRAEALLWFRSTYEDWNFDEPLPWQTLRASM